MTRLHLLHAIVVRLHVLKVVVVILTPETVVMVGALSSSLPLAEGFSIQDETVSVVRSALQGAHADVTAAV